MECPVHPFSNQLNLKDMTNAVACLEIRLELWYNYGAFTISNLQYLPPPTVVQTSKQLEIKLQCAKNTLIISPVIMRRDLENMTC